MDFKINFRLKKLNLALMSDLRVITLVILKVVLFNVVYISIHQ